MFQIKAYEKLECVEERRKLAREIYDNFIMKELLSHSHVSTIFCLTLTAMTTTETLSFTYIMV